MKPPARIESLELQLESVTAFHVRDHRGSEVISTLSDDRDPEHVERREALVVFDRWLAAHEP
jgi:hypothetical protein